MSEPTSFDQFWNAYDNKKSREKVECKWYSLSAKDQTACMESLPKYIKATPDRQFRKHPATYLNQKCWNDSIYVKEEERQTYTEPSQPTSSTYQPKEFDRAEGIQHLRDKLKSNYENGGYLLDYGDVYTTILRDFIEIPKEVGFKIHQDAVTEATRTRNRFEDRYSGNVTSDVRDARLNWMLDKFIEYKREIYLEI